MDPKGPGSDLQENARESGRFRRNMPILLGLVLAAAAAPASGAGVDPGHPAPLALSFARDVAPILDRWCVSCHGAKEAQADLRLDSYAGALRGGEDGPVIIPGDLKNSQLVGQIERRLRPPMPPKKRLPRDPVATIRAWIAGGARP